MNGWMIAFLVWYAFSFGGAIVRWTRGNGRIEVTALDMFLAPAITLTLLYMGGAFHD